MKDLQIRETLRESLLLKYYQDESSKVIEEMNVCLGDARIDIAVVNGAMHGYEIKSESDTLQRLSSQITTYQKVFDYISVVPGTKHIGQVMNIVPEFVGLIVIERINAIAVAKTVRPAQKNTLKDTLAVCQLLWRDETIQLLNFVGIKKGIAGKSKLYLWKLLSETAPIDAIEEHVRRCIKQRQSWRDDQPPR
jgi:hypothetical protein